MSYHSEKRPRSSDEGSLRRPWKQERSVIPSPSSGRRDDEFIKEADSRSRYKYGHASHYKGGNEITPPDNSRAKPSFHPAPKKGRGSYYDERDIENKEVVKKLEKELEKKDEENESLKSELKQKRKEIEWKTEEMGEKRKEITRKDAEINILKNKKDKEGTIAINEALNKKNNNLKKEKKKLYEENRDLHKSVKTNKLVIKQMEEDASTNGAEDEEKINKYKKERDEALKESDRIKSSLKRYKEERNKSDDDLKKSRYEHKEQSKRMEEASKAAKNLLRKEIAYLETKIKGFSLEKSKSDDASIGASITGNKSENEAAVFKSRSLAESIKKDKADQEGSDDASTDGTTDGDTEDEDFSLKTNGPIKPKGAQGKDVTIDASPILRNNDKEVAKSLDNSELIPLDIFKDGDEFVAPLNSTESTPKEQRKVKTRSSKRKLLTSPNELDDPDIEALAADDSFDTLPSNSRKRGKKVVTNSTKLKKKENPPPAKAMRATNRNFAVTCLNESISFIAISRSYRSEHNVSEWGVKPCGLFPTCSTMFRGGEDIAKAFVISPDFHKHYNREAWVCFFHCEASMNGEEVQTVVNGEVEDTPTKVDSEEKDVPAAPSKPKHNKNEDEK